MDHRPGGAAAAHVGLPDFGPPGTPVPLAFGDQERIRQIVAVAGFHDAAVDAVTKPMRVAEDADDAVAFITSLDLETRELAALLGGRCAELLRLGGVMLGEVRPLTLR